VTTGKEERIMVVRTCNPLRDFFLLSNKPTTEELVTHIRGWSINRIKYGMTSDEDALSIIAEFEEWIEPEGDELEILSLDEGQ